MTLEVWTMGGTPKRIEGAGTPLEKDLEDLIERQPDIVERDLTIIGRQVRTDFNRPLDLLAIRSDGAIVVIELKRGKGQRDIVSQTIEYASWIATLKADDLLREYAKYEHRSDRGRQDLEALLRGEDEEDGPDQADDTLKHKIVIVVTELPPDTQRMIDYLVAHDVPIEVVTFSVFDVNGEKVLVRSRLDGDDDAAERVTTPRDERIAWNGEFFVQTTDEEGGRSWEDARNHGFVSAGGSPKFSRAMHRLRVGSRIWVRIPGRGYVGTGTVKSDAVPLREFMIDGRPATDVLDASRYYVEHSDDPERAEYFVRIDWDRTVPKSDAIKNGDDGILYWFRGDAVARPRTKRWLQTVEFLRRKFGVRDAADET